MQRTETKWVALNGQNISVRTGLEHNAPEWLGTQWNGTEWVGSNRNDWNVLGRIILDRNATDQNTTYLSGTERFGP